MQRPGTLPSLSASTPKNPGLLQGAVDWLNHTGESIIYRSHLTGQSKTAMATIEQDTTLIDDQGMAVRDTTVNLNPQEIPVVQHLDVIITADGSRYLVDELVDSPGYLLRAFISPE